MGVANGQQRRPRFYSKAKTRQMFERIEATKRANIESRIAEQVHRLSDEFEIARMTLQRRGHVVYALTVHQPGSELFCVNQTAMSRDEVIAFAERCAPPPKKEI